MNWQAISDFLGSEVGRTSITLLRICVILVGAWVLTALLSRLIRTFRKRISLGLTAPEQVKRAETLGRVFRYAVSVLVTLVAGVLVLSELGISVAPILGAAGVVGLAIGFGAQNLVKDYFTGLFLLLENQLSTGDVVTIAGVSGLVEDITLRYVRLRDYGGHVHYVSNGLITTVTNRTHGFAYAVMDVGVAYREQVDAVLQVMREVGAELADDANFRHRILEPLDIAGVESLGDSAVVLRCRFKVPGLEQWSVRREYLRRVKAAFDRKGIEIPFPHLTLYAGADQGGQAPPFRLQSVE
ncbi:MAG TPA: mechanosensitive ion channel family protein [Steroidobacteraceae bacterium]|nr:mechanosensitive ion channel family protein [Steroidobacteraceae bacterium]